MRTAVRHTIAASALLTFSVVAVGCKSNAVADLSGYWTSTGQVTQMKLEKTDNGYRVIPIPAMFGKCITTDMPIQMHSADKNDLADMQIQGLQQALVGTNYPRVKFLAGSQGDWTVNHKHISSGYAFDLGDGPREVHHTDGCYGLDGKLVQP